jgi:SAM-dependent methyltransferase
VETSTLFQDKAALYAQARPHYPSVLFAFLASLTASRARAWDCATGSGQAAIGLANHFDRVEATDIADGPIANAFVHDRVKYSVQPAETTNFAAHDFDLINVAQALHWFDLERFWTEVRRVLRPGGIFAAYCYAWSHVSPEIDAAVEAYVKGPVSGYWAPNNRLCWDGYRTIAFPFEPLQTPTFTLTNTWDFPQFMEYMHTWSAVRRCMDKNGTGFYDLAGEKILEAWGDQDSKREVRSPLYVVVGRV